MYSYDCHMTFPSFKTSEYQRTGVGLGAFSSSQRFRGTNLIFLYCTVYIRFVLRMLPRSARVSMVLTLSLHQPEFRHHIRKTTRISTQNKLTRRHIRTLCAFHTHQKFTSAIGGFLIWWEGEGLTHSTPQTFLAFCKVILDGLYKSTTIKLKLGLQPPPSSVPTALFTRLTLITASFTESQEMDV